MKYKFPTKSCELTATVNELLIQNRNQLVCD